MATKAKGTAKAATTAKVTKAVKAVTTAPITDNHTDSDRDNPTDESKTPGAAGEAVGASAEMQPDAPGDVLSNDAKAAVPEAKAAVPEVKAKAAVPEAKAAVPEVKAKAAVPEVKAAIPAAKAAVPDDLEPYLKAYPKEKAFYRTSDGNVFLAVNQELARDHQKHIDKSKEVAVYKVV